MPEVLDDLVARQINECISRLRSPISDEAELLGFLTAPLDALGLLSPLYRKHNTLPWKSLKTADCHKVVPQIQLALLQHVSPTWEKRLKQRRLDELLYQYFAPDAFFSTTPTANYLALCGYDAILSCPLQEFSVAVLRRLSALYPIDKLYEGIFGRRTLIPSHRQLTTWDDCVRNVCSVPTKVANFLKTTAVPSGLDRKSYFSNLCVRIEILVNSFKAPLLSDACEALASLTTKLNNLGLFPRGQLDLEIETSFFTATLPVVRSRLEIFEGDDLALYSANWSTIWSSLPAAVLSNVLASLFTSLAELPDELDTSNESRGLVKREARLVSLILGRLEDDHDEKWDAVSSAMLMHKTTGAKARVLVCWAAISDENAIPPMAVEALLSRIMDVWASPAHIKHSLLSHHQALSLTLLLTITTFDISAPQVQLLSLNPSFIQAVGTYIAHLDPAVRRCGMLVAEIVAERTGKSLDFGLWDGEGEGQEWCKKVRELLRERDINAEEATWDVDRLEIASPEDEPLARQSQSTREDVTVSHKKPAIEVLNTGYDSDDSLTGYASTSSSRSPSPTPSEMEEIEKDPTLNVGKKKVQKPVYLADLGVMLQTSAKPDDPQAVDRIEVGLNCAEELIRRKRDFGLELEENAVNLVYALIGLQNNYELDGFDERRQGAVTALVACCPRKAAPAIVEQFFKNQYSTAQRFVMLTALALGARELASLPVPPSTLPPVSYDFPSKKLPGPLHRKYITDKDIDLGAPIRRLVDDISRVAIQSGKDAAEAKVPQIVRDRQLRIKRDSKVTEVNSLSRNQLATTTGRKGKTYTMLAAEYFLGPLIGQFWQFLRDEQAREARSALRSSTSAHYRGTGTGIILSPLVLAQFLNTAAVLMHAARYSPAFLAVLAPDALELAVTLGTRPMSGAEEDREREASVLTASLELALVILDGCLELDNGRSLGLEHTTLLLAAGEWAGHLLKSLEDGVKVPGGGGVQELRLRRSAAGLVLKVDELTSQWRQSMVTL